MSGVYLSGVALNPEHGTKGHAFIVVELGVEAIGDLFPEKPALFRCLRCHSFTYKPREVMESWCTGDMPALTEGAA